MKKLLLAAAMLFALGTTGAHANPDVWVKNAMTLKFEDGKIAAITFDWRFDEYFSSRTILTYDADKSGALEPKEVEHLRREAFDPLKKFHYYVHIWEAGKKRENLKVQEFSARIDDAHLMYRFTVALTPPADPKAGAVITSLNDREFYVDFRFIKKNFILVDGAMGPGCKFQIKRGRGAQSGHPQPVTLKCGGST